MISSRRSGIWSALPLLGALSGLASGLVGCVVDSGSAKSPDSAEEAALAVSQESRVAGDARPEGRGGRGGPGARRAGFGGPGGPGGPGMLLMTALHELDLTDAQKATIDGALAAARPGPGDRGPGDRGRFTALAAAVRAGKVDATTVPAAPGGDDRAAHQAAAAGAIQTLHATLTPEQRRALVDTLKARMAEHGPPRGERGGPPGGERGGEGGPLGHLLRDLALTDAQREAVAQALKAQRPSAADHDAMKQRFEAMRGEMDARLEGFAADSFDAKAFVAPPAGVGAGGPGAHGDRMVKDLAVVVPLLDPAQREALAADLENGPPPGGERGGGPRGGRERGPRGGQAR